MPYYFDDDESALCELKLDASDVRHEAEAIANWLKSECRLSDHLRYQDEAPIWIPKTTPFWDEQWKLGDHGEVHFEVTSADLDPLVSLLQELGMGHPNMPRVSSTWEDCWASLSWRREGVRCLFGGNSPPRDYVQVAKCLNCANRVEIRDNEIKLTGSDEGSISVKVRGALLAVESPVTTFSKFSRRYRNVVNVLSQAKGNPAQIRLGLRCKPTDIDSCISLCKSIAPAWNMKFHVFGKDRGAAFDSRLLPDGETIKYPVFQNTKLRENPHRITLEILVLACHSGSESYLQLYTQRDEAFLRSVADGVGMKVRM